MQRVSSGFKCNRTSQWKLGVFCGSAVKAVGIHRRVAKIAEDFAEASEFKPTQYQDSTFCMIRKPVTRNP
jgi:hypothetical protein